jgi:RNA polymerase sigma-70 factor (ECF subfamily)
VEAVGELYDRHHTRIYRYLWSRVRDPHLAEDLTGEVFARMVRDLPGYRPRGIPFQAWLYRIAHNLAVDHQRRLGRHPLVPLDSAETVRAEGQNPETKVERQLILERVEEALSALDSNQRDVVVLRFLVGLSLREAAAALDRSVASIKSLQHRGLVALRAALQEGEAG